LRLSKSENDDLLYSLEQKSLIEIKDQTNEARRNVP
jgi:hypothetical protein